MANQNSFAPLRWLTFSGHAVSAAAMIALTLLITTEVFLRYLFGYSMQFVDDLSGYLLVLMTFFGANHALRSGALLRVDFIFNRFPRRGQRILDVSYDIICSTFCAILTYYFGRLVYSSFTNGVTSATMESTPMFIPQLAMPVGMALMSATFLLMAWEKATGHETLPTLTGHAAASAMRE